MKPSTWDERTDNKLRGVGHSSPPSELRRDERPGIPEDPEGRYVIVWGFYGPTVIPEAELEGEGVIIGL